MKFPPTNNQLRTSTNPTTHTTIPTGQITTESVQRRAPGHVARQCREKKRAKDSQRFKDKALLMEAKGKGVVLDAEAEAFLADVECTVAYAKPLAITTTTTFEVSHEDAYDSDVDEAPYTLRKMNQTSGNVDPLTYMAHETKSTSSLSQYVPPSPHGAVVPKKPKVFAPSLYAMTPKYVPPQRRNNRDVNAPLPRKDTVPLVTKTNVNHDKCGVKTLKFVNAKNSKVKNKANVKKVWKPIDKVFANVGSKWKPTGRIFTLGDTCPLTKITKPESVPFGKSRSVSTSASTSNPVNVIDLSANQLDPNKKWVSDVPNATTSSIFKCRSYRSSFVIVGYGDNQLGDTIITQVYYVEGLSHNLFSVGHFYDTGLEVAFRRHTYYIRNEDKVDLLKGSRSTNLYSILLKDMMEASLLCLLSKSSSTKSWL
nr:integrase, catalytic region, zinc finger, CCHC-type, peptidase aspartic, catalytic [Tanacetum cinerariifolium]